jgi:uncharacterized protein YjbI with pentapeptide repeats
MGDEGKMWVDEKFVDEDWYGRELTGQTYHGCTFREVDLTDTVSKGAGFQSCLFANCRLNASTHTSSAFTACEFRRTSLFRATLDGCKLTGSVFVDCRLRPMCVRGGQWWGVVMRGADLTGLDLSGLPLQEADLSEADLSGTSLRGCDLSRASLRNARLRDADLRGARLEGVDLSSVIVRGTRMDLDGAVAVAESHGAVVDAAAG